MKAKRYSTDHTPYLRGMMALPEVSVSLCRACGGLVVGAMVILKTSAVGPTEAMNTTPVYHPHCAPSKTGRN